MLIYHGCKLKSFYCFERLHSQYLIGEGVAHDEGWMPHGTAQVDQSALGQNDDVTTVFQKIAINLRR